MKYPVDRIDTCFVSCKVWTHGSILVVFSFVIFHIVIFKEVVFFLSTVSNQV